MNRATYKRGDSERASSLGNITQPRQQRGAEGHRGATEGQQRGSRERVEPWMNMSEEGQSVQ